MEEKEKTVLRIKTETFHTLPKLEEFIKDIKKLEQKYDVVCEVIDVKVLDDRLLKP